MSLANWVRQKVSTVGVGSILLTTALSSFRSVSTTYGDGSKLFYSLIDSNNRENGFGTYIAASNSITRDVIFETLEDGVYTNISPSPITLSGNAVMSVMPTTKSLTTHEPVWKTLKSSSAISQAEGYTSPAGVAVVGAITLPGFDAAIVESLGFQFEMNSDFLAGSSTYPLIHWVPTSTNIGVVRWGIEYSVADRTTGNFTVATTAYVEQAASGVIGRHQAIEFDVADSINVNDIDSIVIGRIFRDATHANDTYTADACLSAINLKYLAVALGSPKRVSPFNDWS